MASLKKNFFYSALLTVANYLFPLITYPYVSRVLGVTGIGICNFVDGIVNYFIMFSMMGIATVGVREIASSNGDRSRRNHVFSSLLSLNAITSLLSAIALIAAIFIVPKLYAYKELMGIGVLRLLANFLCMEWLFKGVEDFRYVTLRTVIIKTLYMVSVFVFIRKPEDYVVYYFLLCLTIVANALVNVLYSRRIVSLTFKGLSFKGMTGPFFLIGLYTVMAAMYTSFNVVFLGFTSTQTQVGYYASATKIFGMVIALFTAFTAVMLPRMSAVLASGQEDEFKRIVGKVLRVLFSLGVPVVLLMEAEAGDIIRIISGKGFEGAITPMRIIAPLIIIIGLEQVYVLQTMMPKKFDREIMVNSIIGAVVGVGLNVLLVRSMEAVGSAIVWLISELAVLTASIVVVTRKVGIRFPVASLLSEIARYIPLALLLVLISRISTPFFVRFIIASILTGVYFLFLNLLILENQDVKDCLKAVIPERWWSVLRQLRSHLYLLRLLPLPDAVHLIGNRMAYGWTTSPDRRYELNEQKHALISHFLKRTVIENLPDDEGVQENVDATVPPIWVCWLQGEEAMPELNQVCVKSIRRNAGIHPVVFLSNQNISSYVSVPDSIRRAFTAGKIKPAIYSDYVRCALLARYGGVWLDSTILLTRPLEESWFRSPFMSVRLDKKENESVSRYRWATFCLGAAPGSSFFRTIERYFRAYFSKLERNVDYLLIDYLFDLLCLENPLEASAVERVPISSPDLHTLREIMNEPYDPVRMDALTAETVLFKLTYKMDLRETCDDGLMTYWGYLKHTFLP